MSHQIKIISGGQTGVDRAALDAAIAARLPYGGLIPKGRLAEDGTISKTYEHLIEADTEDYKFRTEANVLDADITLIIGYLPMTGGTHLTNVYCHQHDKTHIFVNLDEPENDNVEKIIKWMKQTNPTKINIAGPRESKHSGIYKKTKKIIGKSVSKLDSWLIGSGPYEANLDGPVSYVSWADRSTRRGSTEHN